MGAEIKVICTGNTEYKDGSKEYGFKQINEQKEGCSVFTVFNKGDVRLNYFKKGNTYTFYVTETTEKGSKNKKVKLQQLFDKTQTKFVKEKISHYERVLNTEFLDEFLRNEIENRMLKDYIERHGVDIREINEQYKKEIHNVYMALIPKRYKEQNKFHKEFISFMNEGNKIKKIKKRKK